MGSSPALDNRRARHIRIIGILNDDVLIGASEAALLLAGGAFGGFGGRLEDGVFFGFLGFGLLGFLFFLFLAVLGVVFFVVEERGG